MRGRILGWIGMLWGGAVITRWLLGSGPVGGSGAYATGQKGALVLSFLLLGVGAYYAFRRPR